MHHKTVKATLHPLSSSISMLACARILFVALSMAMVFTGCCLNLVRILSLSLPEQIPTDQLIGQVDTHVHVLMCLSGEGDGFFSEFEMALKSLLMNAPESAPLTIHLIVDSPSGLEKVNSVIENAELLNWTSRFPIAIQVYDCTDQVPQWRNEVESLYGKTTGGFEVSLRKHTIGTWFRLFADRILPADIKQIIYLDTDVIVMANLLSLWKHVQGDESFHWGKSQCAGFVVFNLEQLPAMWEVVKQACATKMDTLNFREGDQSFLTVFQDEQPDSVGTLPDAWDSHITSGLWKMRSTLRQKKPEIGYIHFNGGGGAKQAWFKEENGTALSYWLSDHPSTPEIHKTFGIVDYYIRIPWVWAHFFASSRIPADQVAHNLTLVPM